IGERRAPVRFEFDRQPVYELVTQLDPGPHAAAVEPSLTAHGNHLSAVDGKAGRGLNPWSVIRTLPRAASRGLPIVVHGSRGRVPPRFRLSEAQKLVGKAEALTSKPLPVSAGTT